MPNYPRNTKLVDGVLMRWCKDCERTLECNGTNFYTQGLRWDPYCKGCRKKRDTLRRSAIRNLEDIGDLENLRYIQEMLPEERLIRNRFWCKEKLASLKLTKEKVRAYFADK